MSPASPSAADEILEGCNRDENASFDVHGDRIPGEHVVVITCGCLSEQARAPFYCGRVVQCSFEPILRDVRCRDADLDRTADLEGRAVRDLRQLTNQDERNGEPAQPPKDGARRASQRLARASRNVHSELSTDGLAVHRRADRFDRELISGRFQERDQRRRFSGRRCRPRCARCSVAAYRWPERVLLSSCRPVCAPIGPSVRRRLNSFSGYITIDILADRVRRARCGPVRSANVRAWIGQSSIPRAAWRASAAWLRRGTRGSWPTRS